MKNNVLLSKINYFYKKSRINIDSLKPIEKYITDKNNPTVFFTMTMVNKVGIDPRSNFDTPLGIYSYPLTKEYYDNLLNDKLPFAGSMPYINIFSVKKNLQNIEQYTPDQEDNDLKKIITIYDKDEVNDILNDKNIIMLSNMSKIWYLTYELTSDPKKWNFLLRKLGYDGIYDPGTGTIHENEPTQAVILNPSIINQIETFYNPYGFVNSKKEKLLNKEDFKIFEKRKEQSVKNLERNKLLSLIEKTKTVPFNEWPYEELLFLALHKKTPSQILENISSISEYSSNFNDVLNEIARRENLTQKTIENLSNSKSSIIRSILAQNSSIKLPDNIILKFIKDDELVQFKLLDNKNLPIEFIKILANNKNLYVASKAKDVLEIRKY